MEIMATTEAKKQINGRKLAASRALGLMAMGVPAGLAVQGSAFADQATDLVNQAGSGGLASASSLMSGSAGTVIYLVVGFSILAFIVGIILWVVHKGQKGGK